MDNFLSKKNCDRCNKELKSRIMSIFNTDCLCIECHTLEQHHEKYEEARQAELKAVKRGNYNFPGIGYPE